MKLDRRYLIERACSKDMTRHHLTQPYLDVEKKRLIATNGHFLAAVPVTVDEGDRTGALPVPAAQAARKVKVRARRKLAVYGDTLHVRREVKFPNIDDVIPKYKAGDAETLTIGLNPWYLAALAEAMGGRCGYGSSGLLTLTILLPKDGKVMLDPILVRIGAGEAIGVIMPGRVGDP